jgi:hypothetical protein
MLCVQVVNPGVRENVRGTRQLTLSKGPEWMGHSPPKKKEFLNMCVSEFIIGKMRAPLILSSCVYSNKKEFSVQVKNKLRVENRNIRFFLVPKSLW